MEAGGFEAFEVTEAGLREGIFFETLLGARGPAAVRGRARGASVLQPRRASTTATPTHTRHVARLALQLFDALAAAGLHAGDAEERELLWAAAMLHDVGVAVDYDDHHKHSRYLDPQRRAARLHARARSR